MGDHHDVTLHTDGRGARMHLVLSLSGAAALLSAGVLWGRMDSRVAHLEVEIERRPTTAEVAAIRDDIAEIKRAIERLEARITTTTTGGR